MTSPNMAALVRQRLLNKARSDKRPFNELLQYYAIVSSDTIIKQDFYSLEGLNV